MSKTRSTFEKTAQSPQAWWLDLQLAVVFLTRLPWRINETLPPENLMRALRCFGLVGLLVGGVTATAFGLAHLAGLPATACALLAVGAGILITGGLHEDGLADVADGFGGGYDRSKKLEIMRDSRVGAYGVLALILSVGLRVAALSSFSDWTMGAAVIVGAATLSRMGPVFILYVLNPARNDGLAATMEQPHPVIVAQAALLSIVLFFLCVPAIKGAIAVLIATVLLFGFARLAQRQIGGHSGDVCGAAQQLLEVTLLLCLVATP